MSSRSNAKWNNNSAKPLDVGVSVKSEPEPDILVPQSVHIDEREKCTWKNGVPSLVGIYPPQPTSMHSHRRMLMFWDFCLAMNRLVKN